MKTARKRRTKKAPKGMPDVHTRFSLGKTVDFDRSDVVTEALRLAYVAGARDGAFESARDVAWLAANLIVPRSQDAPDATSSVNEMWKQMHSNASQMGAHCMKMQRLAAYNAKRDARLVAKKGKA